MNKTLYGILKNILRKIMSYSTVYISAFHKWIISRAESTNISVGKLYAIIGLGGVIVFSAIFGVMASNNAREEYKRVEYEKKMNEEKILREKQEAEKKLANEKKLAEEKRLAEEKEKAQESEEEELPKRINITFGQVLKGLPFTMDKGCDTECDIIDTEVGAMYMGDDQKPNDYENGLIHDAVMTIGCGSMENKPCTSQDKIFEATLSFGTEQEFMLQQDKKNMGKAYKFAEDVYFYERNAKYLEMFVKNILPTENAKNLMEAGLEGLRKTPESGGADYVERGKYFTQEFGDIKLEWFMPTNRPYFSVTVLHN